MTTLLTIILVGVAAWVVWYSIEHGGRLAASWEHRNWVPDELRGAVIAFAEKEFRAHAPFPVGAVVDRVYRLANGQLVLMELKQRERVKVYPSDIVELSVQKIAIESSGAGQVSLEAFVVVESPSTRRKTAIRVALLSEGEVLNLRQRYLALKNGSVAATRADHPMICKGCPYVAVCRPSAITDTRQRTL